MKTAIAMQSPTHHHYTIHHLFFLHCANPMFQLCLWCWEIYLLTYLLTKRRVCATFVSPEAYRICDPLRISKRIFELDKNNVPQIMEF
jgi:hypothetical protein